MDNRNPNRAIAVKIWHCTESVLPQKYPQTTCTGPVDKPLHKALSVPSFGRYWKQSIALGAPVIMQFHNSEKAINNDERLWKIMSIELTCCSQFNLCLILSINLTVWNQPLSKFFHTFWYKEIKEFDLKLEKWSLLVMPYLRHRPLVACIENLPNRSFEKNSFSLSTTDNFYSSIGRKSFIST